MEIDKDVQSVINEMAKIADIDKPIGLYVYSNNHGPAHFHLGISGGDSIRFAIPDKPFETQQQLKNLVLSEDKDKIPAYQKYFAEVIDILKSKPANKYGNYATYLAKMQEFWYTFHETDDWADVNGIAKQ